MRLFVNQYGFKKPGMGLDTLVSYLKEFGLGHKLGVENPAEIAGFIPDSKYYDKLYKREINGWKATYMLSIGIGQESCRFLLYRWQIWLPLSPIEVIIMRLI